MNKGINNAKGRFVIRIDSDDYVHKDFLKIPYLFLTLNSDFDAVSLDYYKVDDRENIISKTIHYRSDWVRVCLDMKI